MRFLFLILFSVLQLFVTMPIHGLDINIKSNHSLHFKKNNPNTNSQSLSIITNAEDDVEDEDSEPLRLANCFIHRNLFLINNNKYSTLYAVHSSPNYSEVAHSYCYKIPIYLFVENFRI